MPQSEEALRLTAPEVAARYRRKLKARVEVANLFKPMCSALEYSRAAQGKEAQPHHYSNESNMIARIVLGGLTTKLEHMSYLERTNITLLDMGWITHSAKLNLPGCLSV